MCGPQFFLKRIDSPAASPSTQFIHPHAGDHARRTPEQEPRFGTKKQQLNHRIYWGLLFCFIPNEP